MKLILVGAGSFGFGWYTMLKRDHPQLGVVVVDKDPAIQAQVADPFYTSLESAIIAEAPDFIINATPPAVHTAVNHIAFDHRLPVLCEKPISDNYPDSIQVVERAAREGIPFMIAENYRRRAVVRKLKALIDEGAIGDLSALHVDFYRHFHTEKAYFLAMPDPLLVDVAIHHFDMIRYFTGSEGRHIFARSYNPPGSLYTGNMNLNVFLEMESGVIVSFNGSMVASAPETPWNGNWIIEGTQGALLLTDDRITLIREGQLTPVDDLSDVAERSSLQDFIQALAEHREAETWGPDYLKTQALVHFAQESSRAQCMLAVEHYKLTAS